MAMSKGFLAAGPQLTSSSGGSAKKKKAKAEKKKPEPSLNDIYAVPGAGAAREKAMKKRDVLDYSRFDSIGSREAKRDARESALKQIPPGLRSRLGAAGEDMVLDMAEKMKANPELRPSPEDMVAQLKQEKEREETARAGGGGQQPRAKARGSVPVARPTAVAPDAELSTKIDSARSSFEEQMEQMKEESERLAKQQERLEKMTGDSGPGELLSFLQEQGVSEEDMQVMMSDPNKGMALLQQVMSKGLGLDKEDAMAAKTMEQMETVDQVTSQLKELATADSQPAAAVAPARRKETRRAKAKPGSEAAEIQRQIEEAELQMEQARLNAERAAAEHAKVAAQADSAKSELAKVEKEKERAAAEIDSQTEALKRRGDNAGAEELLAAKQDAEQAAAAPPGGGSQGEDRPLPAHTVTEVGSPVVGLTALKLEIKLPLVGSFKDVELELTETEVRLSCEAYAPLIIVLKHPVDPDAAAAKFSKKSHKLRVELPIVGNVPMPAQGQML
jgi:Asp-tRNA(Asn)/Glu-tRNA(Gln) amidotransferase C subunit